MFIQIYSKGVFTFLKNHILSNGRLKITGIMGKIELGQTPEKLYNFVNQSTDKNINWYLGRQLAPGKEGNLAGSCHKDTKHIKTKLGSAQPTR